MARRKTSLSNRRRAAAKPGQPCTNCDQKLRNRFVLQLPASALATPAAKARAIARLKKLAEEFDSWSLRPDNVTCAHRVVANPITGNVTYESYVCTGTNCTSNPGRCEWVRT